MLKVSVFQYYIGNTIKEIWARMRRRILKAIDKITGKWYCEGCKLYHPGRVYEFFICGPDCDGVCSKHITPEGIQNCPLIKIGGYRGKNVTEQVKQLFKKGLKDGE